MAWIRRSRTGSGATAVQIFESVRGRRQMVKHVGSAHTEAELGVLLQQAELLLAGQGQDALDVDVEPTPIKAELLTAPVDKDAALLDPQDEGEQAVEVAARVATPRVSATSSRLLFDLLARVYDDLGFDGVDDATFRDLVIARIVEPTSIRDVGRVLTDLGQRPASEKTRRRALARSLERGYRDRIASACFTHAASSGDISLVLYDVTTLYFEAEHEDELRRVGFSKERRVDPQIVVGLLVDRGGFPLEIGCYEGNKAETTTIIPIVKQFQDRHGLADMVVVADAGMLSASNLKELDEAGLRFIVGSRVTKAPVDLASHFRWHGDAFTNGQVIDTITPRTATAAARADNDANKRAEPIWDPSEHPRSWRAVWAYSAKRAARDRRTLTLQANKAKAVIAGEKAARTPRFVKTTSGQRALDEVALARAYRLVGLKGYVSNLPAEVMPASEVIGSYHELWHVEQSFRMSKTDLRARPMFVRTRQAIEAHLTLVFTALAVSREVQAQSGLAIGNVIRQLRPLRTATIVSNGAEQDIPPVIPARQQDLLDEITSPNPRH